MPIGLAILIAYAVIGPIIRLMIIRRNLKGLTFIDIIGMIGLGTLVYLTFGIVQIVKAYKKIYKLCRHS